MQTIKDNLPRYTLVGDVDGLKVANYSIAANYVAHKLKQISSANSLLEVCCGIGATTIELAKEFANVYAVDIEPSRINSAQLNVNSQAQDSTVTFISDDIFSTTTRKNLVNIDVEVIYTGVEWTTTGVYGQDHASSIDDTNPSTKKLYHYLKSNFSQNICMRLPKNINYQELRDLGKCEIEEVFKNGELKFVYVYFGNLVQNDLSQVNFEIL